MRARPISINKLLMALAAHFPIAAHFPRFRRSFTAAAPMAHAPSIPSIRPVVAARTLDGVYHRSRGLGTHFI